MAKKIGELLVERGVVTQEVVEAGLEAQRLHGGRLGSHLLDLGALEETELVEALCAQKGAKPATPAQLEGIQRSVLSLIAPRTASRYEVVPLERDDGRLLVAMTDPDNLLALDEIAFITSLVIEPLLASERAIGQALERYYGVRGKIRARPEASPPTYKSAFEYGVDQQAVSLAELHESRGAFALAAEIYEQLLQANPDSERFASALESCRAAQVNQLLERAATERESGNARAAASALSEARAASRGRPELSARVLEASIHGAAALLVLDSTRPWHAQVIEAFEDALDRKIACSERGSEAMRALDLESPPKLVVTTATLPDGSGYELCRQVKQHPRLRGTPVVLVHEPLIPLDHARAMRVGVDAVLELPADRDAIGELIAELDVNASSDARTSPEPASVEPAPDEPEPFDADSDDLREVVGRLVESVRTLQAREEAIRSRLGDVVANELARRLPEEVESAVVRLREAGALEPAELADVRTRAEAARSAAHELDGDGWRPGFTSDELRARLRERGFLVDETTARELLSALTDNWLVVLRGPPGTGKTVLARLLAEIVLDAPAETASARHSVHSEWSVDELIGGLTMVNGHIGPTLGCLTEAVLCSIEREGKHWLILDEINRGNVSTFMSPMLAELDEEQPHVPHPRLGAGNRQLRLPMPRSFRIIGTMNTLDQHLFDYPVALARRTGFVAVLPLRAEDEAELLREHVSRRHAGDADEAEVSPVLPDLSQRAGELADAVRDLCNGDSRGRYRFCEIGSAIVMKLLDRAFSSLAGRPAATEEDVLAALDSAIGDVLLPQLESSSVQALESVQGILTELGPYESSSRKLAELIGERRAF